jgi:hypothetical protein
MQAGIRLLRFRQRSCPRPLVDQCALYAVINECRDFGLGFRPSFLRGVQVGRLLASMQPPHPLKLLHRHHHDHRPIVLGDRHGGGPCCVDQFAEVIFRVGRRKLAHPDARAAGAVLAKLAESAIRYSKRQPPKVDRRVSGPQCGLPVQMIANFLQWPRAIDRIQFTLDNVRTSAIFAPASGEGLTPSLTCLPGQGGSRKGMRPLRQRNGSRENVSPPPEIVRGHLVFSV